MGTTRITYLAGLDGLRCLAVVAVLLYHADTGVLPGGFLGVEVFFVISGFLITSLLAAEWEQRRGIDLRAFWLRRARRLLPASWTMIVATLAFAVLVLPSEVAGLRGAAAAGLLSVSNWYDVLSQQSYFEAVGRPPLLRHLWSLGVEAQFYALWPPLMLLGLRRGGRGRLLAFALAGAAASAGLMALLYQPGDDPSRVYYGTDTRATGLLLGSALALVWTPADPLRRVGRGLLDGAGLAGLAALACLGLRLDEFAPLLYRGGFAAVGLATAAVIAVAVHPRARLTPGLLGWRPLRWLGLRSYGIYLWHWPVFMVTRPELDLALNGPPLLLLRLAATVLLAELSYRYVEMPARSRSFGGVRLSLGALRWRTAARWAAPLGAALVALVLLGASVVAAKPPDRPAYLDVDAIDTWASDETPQAAPSPEPSPPPVVVADPEADPAPRGSATWSPILPGETWPPDGPSAPTPPATAPSPAPVPAPQPAAPPPSPATVPPPTAATAPPPTPALAPQPTSRPASPATPPPAAKAEPPTVAPAPKAPPTAPPTAKPEPPAAPPPSPKAAPPAPRPTGGVSAIGDSVMLAAREALRGAIPGIEIDAAISRQVAAAIGVVRARASAGQLGGVVVIHVGNNGTFTARQFDEMMAVLGGERRVVFVNLHVPRSWEQPNNGVIAAGVGRYPNAVLVDWHSASAGRPDLFWDDGIHLRPAGAAVYAGLIAAAASR